MCLWNGYSCENENGMCINGNNKQIEQGVLV